MANHKPKVYFGASDFQNEAFINRDSFLRSLVYGILFHGDQVIPDSFLYTSSHLIVLILNNPSAFGLIRTALRNGAIVPAFRRDPNGSFETALMNMTQDGIHQGVHHKALKVSQTLDIAMSGQSLRSMIWPDRPLSVSYRSTIERAILTANVPLGLRNLERFWESSLEIRQAIADLTEPDSRGGFRRSDLYNSVAHIVDPSLGKVNDVRAVWSGIADPEKADTARRLLKWINYCYHFNQGRMFELQPSLVSMDELDHEFSRVLAELVQSDKTPDVFKQNFVFPSVEALLTVEPQLLLDVRDSDVGAQYFSALQIWELSPTPETAATLLDCLERYSVKLRDLYLTHGRPVVKWGLFLSATIPLSKGRLVDFSRKAIKMVSKELLGRVLPGIGLTSLVTKCASATFESLPLTGQVRFGQFLGIKSRIRFELEPRKKSIVQEGEPREISDATFE
jgi:hypothetical protein